MLTIDSAGVRAHLELIDIRTGERRWDSRGLPVGDVRGFFDLPDRGLLLVYGLAGDAGAPRWPWLGVDLATGALRWESDSLLPEAPAEFDSDGSGLETSRGTFRGHQLPLVDTDSSAVLFLSEAGPVKINFRTGTRLWGAPSRMGRPPARVQEYPPLLYADGVLYAAAGKGLLAYAADGRPLWPEARKFPGQVAQLKLTPSGLLVRGSWVWSPPGSPIGGKPFLQLLDPATGERRWAESVKRLDVTTPFVRDGARVYAATRDRLYRIALDSGTQRELGVVKFRGGEQPLGLEYRDGSILVEASHNLALFDTAGTLRYQAFFEQPPASIGAKVLRVAMLAAVVGAIATSSYYGYYYIPPLRPADRLHPYSSDYVYVVAAHADSAARGASGILKVPKSTGAPVSWVPLGIRAPDFRVDESVGLLFILRDSREIECYRF